MDDLQVMGSSLPISVIGGSANGEGISDDEKRKKIDLIESFLNKEMAITITDGRVVVGEFLCTDKDANVILGGTQEYCPGKPGSFFLPENCEIMVYSSIAFRFSPCTSNLL